MSENHDIPATEAPEHKAESAAAAATSPRAGWHTWMAAAAALLAIVAWVALCFNGYTALATGVAALIAAILGLHAHTRAWRNLATTALIAAGVLIVVLTAFIIVIFWGLNSI